ncbi:MAG: hypothetical protein FWH18_08555 [Marinilabiliaceae bacterium]|nr:hypothetical protein [Marinilabiliaceae bacterium]
MKKYLIVLLSVCLPMFWQCDSRPSRTEVSRMNDSLLIANAQQEAQLNKFLESFGAIEENLRIIKEKEKIISLKVGQGDIEDETRNEINEDIMLIYELMLQNKNRVQELEKQLKKSGAEGGRLSKLVENLTAQLEERSIEISKLNEMLLSKDVEIEELSQSVNELASSLESMRIISTQTQEELTATQDLMYTAYYAMGTKKELKDRKISVGGDKKLLTKDFDKNYFKAIDVRELNSISISGKKPKILTIHPASSFKLNEGKGNSELIILNKDDFWSVTRYLVIQIN